MEYFIRIISGSAPVQKYKIEQGETLVGRSRSANVRVKDQDVSGKHFLLRFNGEELTVENLSSNGTMLDEQMLFEIAQVKSGQHIYAGATLDCIIEDEALSEENDAKTYSSALAAVPATGDQTPAGTHDGTAPGTASGTENKTSDSHNTSADVSSNTDDSGTGRGDTAANKTRVATPDEIQLIKEQKKKRFNRIKAARIILLLLVAGAIGMLFFTREEPVPGKLIWAKKPDGQWNTDTVSLPGKSTKEDGFAVYYPKYKDSKVSVQNDQLKINTFLGENAEVPLELTLDAVTKNENLDISLTDNLKIWMAHCNSSPDSRWMFENISPLQFFGADNGLPSLTVSYVRENKNESSYGIARIFRNGATAYILRTEVPFNEKERAEHILNTTAFLLFSNKFIANNWAGGLPALELSWDALQQLRSDINNAAPSRLVQLQRKVYGVLSQAVKSDDQKKYEFAMELLMLLRNKQKICFNALKIKQVNAALEHNRGAVKKICAESAAIFSLDTDKRFYDIRQNLW